MSEVTQILAQLGAGDPAASDKLLILVYDELRELAAAKLAHEQPGQTLQATALVHEAYMRLVGSDPTEQQWENRGHFFAAAAEAMRRILVERARSKKGPKQGGHMRRVDVDFDLVRLTETPAEELVALDEALQKFASIAPEKAKLVKLRFFVGLTIPQAAAAMGISHATAERYWTYAKVWLFSELQTQ